MAHSNRAKEAPKEGNELAKELAQGFIESLKEQNFFSTLANAISSEIRKILVTGKKETEVQAAQGEKTHRVDKDPHQENTSQLDEHVTAEAQSTHIPSPTSELRGHSCNYMYISRHTEELTQKLHNFRKPNIDKPGKHSKVNNNNFTLQKAS